GFKDIVLNRFLNDFDFIVDIPKEENLKDNAYIELKYRYSNLLDFNKSTICVYINGLPYQDKRLSEKNSNLDSMKIKLKDFKNYTRLNIGVKFNLVPKTKDKELNTDEDLFAILLNSSNIYIPTEYEKRRDFRYYPAPLVEKGRFNNLNLVIPNKLDNINLTSLSNIFAYLGHSIKTLDGLSVDYDFDKSKNNLVYGIETKDEIKQKMTVYIEEGKFKFKEGVNITLGEDDAVVQVVDGFLDNTFIIALLAKDKVRLKNIERYLSDFDFVERLKGNVCVINSRGAVKCYELNKIELVDNNKRLFLYLSIASMIIVLILLIFVAIKYKE
ncbi:MAG: cellulose biosynthesis cyclic di-GMP-binding regulatory protein BcsB, partial [Clostridiales bacterium]|nr:cellulose biosynthesis cyclic di-GMP-binding regulatory protein BcsB [Clostridiales bacterium]